MRIIFMQSQKFKSIMKLFCDSKCVTLFLSLLLSKNQIKNTLGVTSIKINGCQKNAIPIQSVESTAQKSMHWWHRIVIYCIGFRSILQMNAAWICVCLCMLCVRAKDIECKQKCRRTIVQIKVVAFFGYLVAMLRCVVCFEIEIEIECATYVIGTILYASSWFYFVFLSFSLSLQTPFSVAFGSRDVRVCVFIFYHYWPPELNGIDAMLCFCCRCRCHGWCYCCMKSHNNAKNKSKDNQNNNQ